MIDLIQSQRKNWNSAGDSEGHQEGWADCETVKSVLRQWKKYSLHRGYLGCLRSLYTSGCKVIGKRHNGKEGWVGKCLFQYMRLLWILCHIPLNVLFRVGSAGPLPLRTSWWPRSPSAEAVHEGVYWVLWLWDGQSQLGGKKLCPGVFQGHFTTSKVVKQPVGEVSPGSSNRGIQRQACSFMDSYQPASQPASGKRMHIFERMGMPRHQSDSWGAVINWEVNGPPIIHLPSHRSVLSEMPAAVLNWSRANVS